MAGRLLGIISAQVGDLSGIAAVRHTRTTLQLAPYCLVYRVVKYWHGDF